MLVVGAIIYSHKSTAKMLSKIEHEIKNDKAIQEVLKKMLEKLDMEKLDIWSK